MTKVDYQFTGTEHKIILKAHGGSKTADKPYIRTQKSTLASLKEAVSSNQPRIALDKVAEELGGMSNGSSSGSWPKDIKQAYNLKSRIDCKRQNVAVTSDPYMALVMQCKEDAKDEKSAYIRQVTCAPEPIVILATEEQMNDIVKFCTNTVHGVFAVDPTFDLGSFSVTTTTYENLNLVSRRGGVHPVMIGPLMIHQKKEATTYSVLVDYLLKSRPELRNLRVLGTDGELALSKSFLEKCPILIHLLCFIHVKNNILNHLKSVGVDESNRRCIIADIFGQQQGTRFEEGIVDSHDNEEFRVRLSSLKSVWLQRLGQVGLKFYHWFVQNKADLMEKKMLKPVRVRAGLGQPPKPYYTNRVECANSLLSSETGHKESSVNKFVASMRALTERQARNIRWAIINKGPYQLQPALSHLQLLEETWFQMGEEEKESYVKVVLHSDTHLKTTQPLEKNVNEPIILNEEHLISDLSTNDRAITHSLFIRDEAEFSVVDLREESGETQTTPQSSAMEISDDEEQYNFDSLATFEDDEFGSTSLQPYRRLENMSRSSVTGARLKTYPTNPVRQIADGSNVFTTIRLTGNQLNVPIEESDNVTSHFTFGESETARFLPAVSQHSSSLKDKEKGSQLISLESPGNETCVHMMPLDEFKIFFTDQPFETIKGIYEKAKLILEKKNAIVPAPGCDPKARMVESTRFKDKPHLVIPGKKGEYRCEKNCPHYNGIRICSHSVATAQQNGELSQFLIWFRQSFSKKGVNLTSTVKTDMPKNPGRKGGKQRTSKRSAKKLPVAERVKRTYIAEVTSSTPTQTPNTNAFYVKKMNSRIKVCQGCRGSLKSGNGVIQYPPFDYCVARQERRQFTDRNSGHLRMPSRETAAHYHLRVACIKTEEPSFVPGSLQISDELNLSPVHEAYLHAEFGI